MCDALLANHLRDEAAQPAQGHSIVSWRMRGICAAHGRLEVWEEVQRRMGFGDMLLLTSRPAHFLQDEIRLVSSLVELASVWGCWSSSRASVVVTLQADSVVHTFPSMWVHPALVQTVLFI